MPTTLPVKQVTRYSRGGKPEEVVETNAGKTRKTVTVYDAVDRPARDRQRGGHRRLSGPRRRLGGLCRHAGRRVRRPGPAAGLRS